MFAVKRQAHIFFNSRRIPFKRGRRQFATGNEADVVIAGGGIVGTCIAYFIKKRMPETSFKIIVLERDLSYRAASTVLSVGGIRQQFSVPGNVEMSLYSANFIKSLESETKGELQFFEEGYLILASSTQGEKRLRMNHLMQKELGANNSLLNPFELKLKFPWIETQGVRLGSLGLTGEGWLDPWSFLMLMKKKAIALGVKYKRAQITGLEFGGEKLNAVSVDNGSSRLSCGFFVNSCGAWSSILHKMYVQDGSILPVVPKKRTVYALQITEEAASNFGDSESFPLVVDPEGVYFRRDGRVGSRIILCGKSPEQQEDPDYPLIQSQEEFENLRLSVDYEFFQNSIWPVIANRVEAFKAIKIQSAWSGLYDYNTFDQNAIIGPIEQLSNVYIATGFSGHGLQQAPAVGRALSEHICSGKYESLDLAAFSIERISKGHKLLENNVY